MAHSASDDGDSARKPSQIILSVAIEPNLLPPAHAALAFVGKLRLGAVVLRDPTRRLGSGFERLESAAVNAEFEEVVISICADDDRQRLLKIGAR